jgi:SAM-dependent methyltransferase
MHQSSYALMGQFFDAYIRPRGSVPLKILDVGSQDINGSYSTLCTATETGPILVYQGLDMAPGKNVDIVVTNLYEWFDVQDESYDFVISGQALEHVQYPWSTMREITRVLKPGGLCCIIVSSAGPVHRYPLDCYRFYRDGMIALANWAGLEVVKAWTDENPSPMYTDSSPLWKDSILIARKP